MAGESLKETVDVTVAIELSRRDVQDLLLALEKLYKCTDFNSRNRMRWFFLRQNIREQLEAFEVQLEWQEREKSEFRDSQKRMKSLGLWD